MSSLPESDQGPPDLALNAADTRLARNYEHAGSI
jgi:hypothetical protein